MIIKNNYKFLFWLLFIYFCMTETVSAQKWKLRAREHFDTVTLKYGNQIEMKQLPELDRQLIFGWKSPMKTRLVWHLV